MKEIVWTWLLFVLIIGPMDQPAEKLEPTYNPPHIQFFSVEMQQPELEVAPTSQPKSTIEEPQPSKKLEPKKLSVGGDRQVYEVSAYAVGDDFTPSHGVTASGEKVKAGRTLACPRSLAFGTEIYIPSLDHTYVCTDRGGRITAGKLDIYMKSRKQALNFGRKDLEIIIKQKNAPGT